MKTNDNELEIDEQVILRCYRGLSEDAKALILHITSDIFGWLERQKNQSLKAFHEEQRKTIAKLKAKAS